MKKSALLIGAAVLSFGIAAVHEAQAQPHWRGGGIYRGGWHGGGWRGGGYGGGWRHRGWGGGGAVAAGLIGGALIGGLISSAAAAPYYG